MKLTAFTDYSLRVLIYLAAQPGRRATIGEICAAFDIKENHLSKVVHFLGKKGWVDTVRGKGGGLSLAMPPQDIGIGEVVREAEGDAVPAECFSGERSTCASVACCELKGVLAEAVNAFHAALDGHTLASITRNRQELASILHFHRAMPHGDAHRP